MQGRILTIVKITAAALLYCCCIVLSAQNIVYRNYGIKDGLAGNTVYFVLQDTKGFMWFGTNQGLSKYDGSAFTNYNTGNGLADNDVFRLAEDKEGRIWLICYNATPCFIQKNTIYNANNDTLLRAINEEGNFFKDVSVDRNGTVWITGKSLYAVNKNTVTKYSTPNASISKAVGYINNHLCVTTTTGVYTISEQNQHITYQPLLHLKNATNSSACFYNNRAYVLVTDTFNNNILYQVGDSVGTVNLENFGIHNITHGSLVANTNNSGVLVASPQKGIIAIADNLTPLPPPFTYLPADARYTYFAYDKEGNSWLSSLNNGVFFIPFNKPEQLLNSNEKFKAVYTLYGTYKYLLAGMDGQYAYYDKAGLKTIKLNHKFIGGTKVSRFCRLNKNIIVAATDFGLFSFPENNPSQYKQLLNYCIKTVFAEGEDTLLIGTTTNMCRAIYHNGTLSINNLWNQRTTSICKIGNTIWFGGLNGLYSLKNGVINHYSEHPVLRNCRINDLAVDSFNNLWIATGSRGIFIVSGNSVQSLTTNNGLPDNRCAGFFKQGSSMWVCSGNTICQIKAQQSTPGNFEIILPPAFIEDAENTPLSVFVESKEIYVAGTAGILQLAKLTQSHALPLAYIISLKTGDSTITAPSPILKYSNNNVTINFTAVSFNNAGKILYKYILNGYTDTIYSTISSVNFNALSPGNYTFAVWAQNGYRAWSVSPALVNFSIAAPFWQTTWFQILMLGTIAIIITLVFKWRITTVKKQEQQKATINRKIAEIELQAVKAHMNEHFIFNSLGGIQNFINKNDTEAANFYLANFGALIRKTLDLSSKNTITLKNEIEYLQHYLVLEKMRFDKDFNYEIRNNITGLQPGEILFPAMILQPYVENAIRHGLRNKVDGNGFLHILFEQLDDAFIMCSIDDNGVGRKKAQEIKTKMHVEYQSKGIQLSNDKIELFNRANAQKITLNIIDKEDSTGNALGTTITIKIPLETL